MTKVRKAKRRKRYQTNVNRKRLRNKLRKLPHITCPQIKQAWEVSKSTCKNLKEMGIAYDPNEVLPIPNTKKDIIGDAKQKISLDEMHSENEDDIQTIPAKGHVVQELEAEAKAPRKKSFRLPSSHIQFVTYLMEKYGEDYKAMTRDKKNYYQLTWKQIRAKINSFKAIPEQYNEYLLSKGVQ